MRLLRRLRSDESGFTLTELLVAASVSIIVLLGAMQVLDDGVTQARRSQDRIDTAQTARAALFAMTRQLHSQVCLGPNTAAIIGDGNTGDYRIRFYNFTGGPSAAYRPVRREFAYDASALTITESVWTPDASSNFPALTYTGAPRTKVIAENVLPTQVSGNNVPIFRYYAYPASGTLTPSVQLTAPLSAADAARAVMVRITLKARASRPGGRAPRAGTPTTSVTDDVLSPTADPNAITGAGAGDCG